MSRIPVADPPCALARRHRHGSIDPEGLLGRGRRDIDAERAARRCIVQAAEGGGSADQRLGEYVDARRVGDATVTVVSDGTFPGFRFVPWLQAPAAEVRGAVPEAD